MKRRLVKLVVFLLLGAIVNVAVAWGCYYAVDPDGGAEVRNSDYRWPPPATWLQKTTLRKLGRQSARVDLWTYHGDWWSTDDVNARRPSFETLLYAERAGLPFVALERCSAQRIAKTNRPIPLYPIWPGFATNTVFYAVILWVVFAAPFALRRRSRIRRGLCPACAYPVGDSDVCPECGRPFPPPLRAGVRGRVRDTSSQEAVSSTHPLAPSLKGGGNNS